MSPGLIRRVHRNGVSRTHRDKLARRETGEVGTESCVALICRNNGALSMLICTELPCDMESGCDHLDLDLEDANVGIIVKSLLDNVPPVVPNP